MLFKVARKSVRFYSTPEVPLKPVAVQLWELRELQKQGITKKEVNDIIEKNELYSNELYTPLPKVRTGMAIFSKRRNAQRFAISTSLSQKGPNA
jgi:hypothetical protein